MLVTFWILFAVKFPLENYPKPYGRATAMPPAWRLRNDLFLIDMFSKWLFEAIDFEVNYFQAKYIRSDPFSKWSISKSPIFWRYFSKWNFVRNNHLLFLTKSIIFNHKFSFACFQNLALRKQTSLRSNNASESSH